MRSDETVTAATPKPPNKVTRIAHPLSHAERQTCCVCNAPAVPGYACDRCEGVLCAAVDCAGAGTSTVCRFCRIAATSGLSQWERRDARDAEEDRRERYEQERER